MKSSRAHYSSSVVGRYPRINFVSKYKTERFNDTLVLSPGHIYGDRVDNIDLRYWNNCKDAISSVVAAGVVARRLDVSDNNEVNGEFITHLITVDLSNQLLDLNMKGCHWLNDRDISLVAQFGILTKLNISGLTTAATDGTIAQLVNSLPLLTSLDVSDCALLTNSALDAIAGSIAPQLIEFKCANNHNFNHAGIYPVILKAERLEVFDMAHCINVSFLGVVMKGSDGKETFASRALKSLQIDGCIHLQTASLRWICLALPYLQEISMRGIPNLTDSMVQGLVRGCSELSYININGCLRITDITWRYIAEQRLCARFVSLRVQNIGGIPAGLRPLEKLTSSVARLSEEEQMRIAKANAALSSDSVRLLLMNSAYLEELDISANAHVQDDAFSTLVFPDYTAVAVPPPPIPLPSTATLLSNNFNSSGSSSSGSSKAAATTATVATTTLGPRALKFLNVAACGLTSYGVACIGKHFPSIEELNISGLKQVNDAALKVIAGCCSKLRVLKANDCASLTDEGVVFICQHAQWLQILQLSFTKIVLDPRGGNVDNHQQYTDKSLLAILTIATRLRVVTLSNQERIEFKSIALQKKFPRRGNFCLQSLDLRGCVNIAAQHLQTIFKRCYALNDLKLPGKFLSETDASNSIISSSGAILFVSSKQFWKATFSRMNYVRKYSKRDVEAQREQAKLLTATSIDTRKGALKATKTHRSINDIEAYHVLQPHPQKLAIEYRDKFTRRMLLEATSARKIQKHWMLHRIWNKFRFRVMARRLAFTYKKVLQYRQWKAKLIAFTENHAARVIQRYCYLHRIMYAQAAKCIQRAYARHQLLSEALMLTEKAAKATQIQRIVRGMLTRLSDSYILGQIYMKLPPFWRQIMKINPPKRRRDEVKIHAYQITELHAEAKHMVQHILSDVARGGVLAPKMPFVVPQPFDKRPYVSLSDGRKLNFFSDYPSLFRAEFLEKTKNDKNFLLSADSIKYLAGSKLSAEAVALQQQEREAAKDKRLPMHTFNQRFWPLTKPPHVEDPSTEEHDPWVNSFEVIQNSRTPLSCEVCHTRLRIISCSTCLKGFCFFCAFRVHTRAFKRNHQMSMMEPRIVKYKEVTPSLVYHIDMAQSVTHDLAYLIKFLRSAAEVQRIQKERQLLRDYEKAEEKKRIALLRSREESREQHDAATRINLIYRSVKAKRLVNYRRLQLRLESNLAKSKAVDASVLMLQRLYRMYAVRNWLSKQLGGRTFINTRYDNALQMKARKKALKLQQKLQRSAAARKQRLDAAERDQRLQQEQNLRAVQTRTQLISQLENLKSSLQQLLDANIAHWLREYNLLQPRIDKFEAQRAAMYDQWKDAQKINASSKLGASANQRDRQEKSIKILHGKFEAAAARLENARNAAWWMTQHLRSCYRRRCIANARFEDTLLRVCWVAKEFAALDRIEFHMNRRLEKLRSTLEMEVPARWVEKYLELVKKQCTVLDSLQEVILKDEISRLESDHRAAYMFDSLMEELMVSLQVDNQFIGERIYLDSQLLKEVYGSELAIRLNEQLIELKAKQKALAAGTIDTLKAGLQEKYNEEDDANVGVYGFPNDDPDLPVEKMCNIAAVIIDPFTATGHCQLNDFLKVYLVQPWLAEESVEDVRLEEVITSMQLEIGGLREELQALKSEQLHNEKTKKQKDRRMKELLPQIELYMEGFEGEAAEEAKEREEALAAMRKEEGEINLYLLQHPTKQQNLSEQQPPLVAQVETVESQIEKVRARLRERVKVRERSSDNFFATEEDLVDELVEAAQQQLLLAEKRVEANERDLRTCETYISSDNVLSDIITARSDITLSERAVINVPREEAKYALQQTMHDFRPRVTATAESKARCAIQTRQQLLQMNQSYFLSLRLMLDEEVRELSSFRTKRKFYEDSLNAFRNAMLTNRRKRAIQLDLEQRKARVNRMREIRLKAMMQAKEQQLVRDRAAAEEKAKQRRERQSTAGQVALATKKAIRGVKDAIHDLRHRTATEMDEEEKRMAANIREKNKDSGVGARPEGIRSIHLTSGREETESFQRQNDHLRSKGLPHFVKSERSLGNQLWLWTQSTFDSAEFITSVYLGHRDRNHENHLDMYKNKYFMIEHAHHDLQLWMKNDRRKAKGIKSFEITFTEAEENRLMIDGFEKLEPNLMNFSLPDTFLWVQKVEKVKVAAKKNRYSLQAELNKVNLLLENSPTDRNLLQLRDRLALELEEEMVKYRKSKRLDTVEVAAQQMALEEEDIPRLKKAFDRIDTAKTGKVTLSQLFEFFEETPIPVNREVFLGFDAVDEDGFVYFGPFMHVLSTFGMFGKHELLRFIFSFVDKDRYGFLTKEQFTALLVGMHPYDRKRTNRALKLMRLDKDVRIYFEEFARINEKYPQLFHPLFALQDSMRTRIMGTEWWYNKLSKYKGVRDKMAMEGKNTDSMVAVELERFKADEEKERRMAERDKAIKQETSEIRKTLLVARQFIDEFS